MLARGRWIIAPLAAALVVLARPVPLAIGQQPASANDAAMRQFATAVALQNREQFELAAEQWNSFLTANANDPRAPRARHYYGLCLLKTQQFAAARSEFEKLLAAAPKLPADALMVEAADGSKNDLLPATYLYKGLAEYNLGQAGDAAMFAQATKTLATLAEKFPNTRYAAQALYYQGDAAYNTGDKQAAARLYEQLLKQFPTDPLAPDARYALGVTQAELNQPAAADATFAAFLKHDPNHRLATEVAMRRGETLLAQGKLDEAEASFARAASTPGFALADHATMRQAAVLFEKKQYTQAAVLYASVPQKFPQSPYRAAAWLDAGKCAYLEGKYDDARKALMNLTPNDGDTFFEAVHLRLRGALKQGLAQPALELAQEWVPHAAKSRWLPQLQLDQADALFDIPAKRSEARTMYGEIAERWPQDAVAPEAQYMAAFAALELGDYQDASSQAERFLKAYADHPLVPNVMYVAAESDLLRGNYRDAEQAFGRLLKKFADAPEAPNWRLRRGVALLLDKKAKDAVAALESVAGKLPSPELNAEAYYRLGTGYESLDEHRSAAKAFDASLRSAPGWRQADDTLLAYAQSLGEQDKLDDARKQLKKLIKDFPKSQVLDKAHYRLAEYAYNAGDYKTATAEYRAVLDGWPSSALVGHSRYGLAWTEYRAGDLAAASKTLDALIDSKPADDLLPRARYLRGAVRQGQGQYKQAIDDLQTFLAWKSAGAEERADATYLLAVCQAEAGDRDKAVATLRKLLADAPKYSGLDKALNKLAWTLQDQGKAKEAAETFERLAQQYPKSPLAAEALYYVGRYQYEQDDFAHAAASFQAAMQKGVGGAVGESAIHLLGWSCFRQGKFDQARQMFDYQRQQFPKGELLSDAAYMQGESLFKEGKYKEALPLYDEVKEPKAKGLLVLARLHAAQAASQIKDWKRSESLLDQARKADAAGEYLPEILYEQAWAKQNQGKSDDALALYQQVTEKTGSEVAARARFMIGEIHFERKDFQQAIADFIAVSDVYGYPQWQAAALYEAGRCFEVRGQRDQARKSYQELLDKHPRSDQAALAKQRLEALGG
ncbi:MAG TPA: tetratricopeptide repeat protein [Pirellulales bacterium]|jgi:TolA-binding protein|nr:tetratricopeptide repeat protein [Pirellulales bacterium]